MTWANNQTTKIALKSFASCKAFIESGTPPHQGGVSCFTRANASRAKRPNSAMKVLCVFLLLSLGCFAQDSKPGQTVPTCVATSFNGQVKRGLPFIQTIGGGLTYQLIPAQSEASDSTHPPKFIGWTIRVAYLKNRGEMERDFTASVTADHATNPREIATRNGRAVQEVLKGGHDVFFPTTLADFANAKQILERDSGSPADSKSLDPDLLRIPIGSASFTIADQQLDGDQANPNGIQALSFKVDLVVPNTIKLPLDLTSKAHPAICPIVPKAIQLK
jgi:hypothetical protein